MYLSLIHISPVPCLFADAKVLHKLTVLIHRRIQVALGVQPQVPALALRIGYIVSNGFRKPVLHFGDCLLLLAFDDLDIIEPNKAVQLLMVCLLYTSRCV